MNNTLSRLNSLLIALHLPPVHVRALQLRTKSQPYEGGVHVSYESHTPVHDLIDKIDRHAGIITRFKLDGSLAPVGERIRRSG